VSEEIRVPFRSRADPNCDLRGLAGERARCRASATPAARRLRGRSYDCGSRGGWLAPTAASGPTNALVRSYSPPARKPVRPLHASPGWDPSVARTSRTSLGVCPQLCTCAAVRPGGGFPSFCPEKPQIEFACARMAVGLPFPVTSPAKAGAALTATTAAASVVAAATAALRRLSLSMKAPSVEC
jgi:hypothetical protein